MVTTIVILYRAYPISAGSSSSLAAATLSTLPYASHALASSRLSGPGQSRMRWAVTSR